LKLYTLYNNRLSDFSCDIDYQQDYTVRNKDKKYKSTHDSLQISSSLWSLSFKCIIFHEDKTWKFEVGSILSYKFSSIWHVLSLYDKLRVRILVRNYFLEIKSIN